MDQIENFLARYRKEYDFFDHAGRLASKMLQDRLRGSGIRAMVTSRPKAFEGLKAKVKARAPRKSYATVDAIFDDIVDLAGVRIAMYFPGDQMQIDNIIRSLFVVLERPRTFPDLSSKPAYEKRFSGYHATHYRVQLNEDGLEEDQKYYAHAKIEVQVASVLMHAWAEVEHDLVYKPQQGRLSPEEYAVLDELNGMVLAGESELKRLQKAGEARVGTGGRSFSNHYDLATHLLSRSSSIFGSSIAEKALGPIDVLFEFVKSLGLGTPDQLEPYVLSLQPDYDKRLFADQIIDQLLAEDPNRYPIYETVRTGLRKEATPETYDQVKLFLSKWVALEKELAVKAEKAGAQGIYASRSLLLRLGIADERVLEDLESARAVRNEVVHGFALPPIKRLVDAGDLLDRVSQELRRF